MKQRSKAILGRVAAVASALPFAISLMALPSIPTFAVDTSIINQGVFQQYIPTISGTYVDENLVQKSITFSYNTVQYIVGSNIAASNPNQTGRAVYMYTARVPSDIYMQGIAPYVTVDIDFGLDNVTYMDTGVLTWVGDYNNKFFNYNLSSLRPYNFTETYYGGQDIRYMQTMAQDVTMPGWFQISESGVRYSGWQYIFESSTPKEFNYGTAHLSTMATDYGLIWVGIISPIANDDYIIKGAVAPPTPGSTSYGASGQISGTVGTDPITADFDITIQSPDYSSELDAIRSDLNPSYDSSALDDMGGVISGYHDEESSLLLAADSALDSLPSLEFDESMIEGAINPLNSFFGINIVGIMIFWVGSIAFISYLLFGKWV